MDDDIYSIILDEDDDSATARARAMAQALHGQQTMGNFWQLSGDDVLGGVGKSLGDQAQNQGELLLKAMEGRGGQVAKRAQLAEMKRRQGALADPNSPTSQLRTYLANQFGGQVAPGTAGNAIDDKELELLERAQTANTIGHLRYGSGAIAGYSPEAIDSMALQVLQSGKAPQFGPGATGAALRQAVFNRVSQLAAGATPGERPTGPQPRAVADLAGAGANYEANSGSLKHAQVQADAVNSFTRTFDKNLGVLEKALAGLTSSNTPLANKALRLWQEKAAGDPNLVAFTNALNTVRSELGKINSGSTGAGGVPISLLEEMEKGLPNDATPAQIFAALNVYRQDSENRRSAMAEQIDEIGGRMAPPPTKKTGGAKKPHGATSAKPVASYRYNKDRTKRIPVYADGTQGEPEAVAHGG